MSYKYINGSLFVTENNWIYGLGAEILFLTYIKKWVINETFEFYYQWFLASK